MTSDADFLATYDPSRYAHPSVTVDVVLLTVVPGAAGLSVVGTIRGEPPAAGQFALPGGFIGMAESLDAAAARVLAEKTGITDVFVEQLYTFGAPGRDPRTRVLSVAYYALVHPGALHVSGRPPEGALLADVLVPWSGETGTTVSLTAAGDELPIAFDHAAIIATAVSRLRGKLWYRPIAFELLPERFTLLELRGVYEAILGRALNKDGFRRRILAAGLVEATGERAAGSSHRPAELFRFRRDI